jgi:hypothetical protein
MAVKMGMSVAVGAGGSVSVAGGMDVSVGRGGVSVARIGVFVGRIGVFVEGGLPVGGTGVAVPTSVGSGSDSRTRGVALRNNVTVGVAVRLAVGVAVGRVDVTVGTWEGVRVGTVAVGKGPSSTSAVWAIAVFVRAAPLELSPSTRHGFPNRIT